MTEPLTAPTESALLRTLRSIAGEVDGARTWSRTSRALSPARVATVFGSARAIRGEPAYELARELGAALAARRWTTVTGGGPGIMQAVRDGSGATLSRAVRIEIPGEVPDTVLDEDRSLTVGTFALRKLLLTHDIDALFVFPGGVGTFDELFEVLVHHDTARLDHFPVVLVQPEGTGLWEAFVRFVQEHLVDTGLASPSVAKELVIAESVEAALAAVAAVGTPAAAAATNRPADLATEWRTQ
ncbi:MULTISPECIES: TIGR00730 family Rossman fold protein [Streptomyces]|uniref:LOG family protein n=1 Tax=Streptomyces TaxID=1883 RepID=UPI00196399FB|nr:MULTISPECIES: TIGR00730 family Rossman fold protein [Streptomyces]QRX95237.1 TIGR00730 family Rossman fold protein [Streptomyces noursei]UJB45937.1 TIGR00730 family Rossman fold protein [Streptomyces sp. A1-5]